MDCEGESISVCVWVSLQNESELLLSNLSHVATDSPAEMSITSL